MSDGLTEAYRGTYFSDKSHKPLSEKEYLERKLRRIEIEIQDLQFERDNIKAKLKSQK